MGRNEFKVAERSVVLELNPSFLSSCMLATGLMMGHTWPCHPAVTFTLRGRQDRTSGFRTTGEHTIFTVHGNKQVYEALLGLDEPIVLVACWD